MGPQASEVPGSFTGPQFGGYAIGTPFVPRDMIAKLHRGERVVNAADNQRGMSSGGQRVVNLTANYNVPSTSNRPSLQQMNRRNLELLRASARNM